MKLEETVRELREWADVIQKSERPIYDHVGGAADCMFDAANKLEEMVRVLTET